MPNVSKILKALQREGKITYNAFFIDGESINADLSFGGVAVDGVYLKDSADGTTHNWWASQKTSAGVLVGHGKALQGAATAGNAIDAVFNFFSIPGPSGFANETILKGSEIHTITVEGKQYSIKKIR